jgi:putative ABC transport system substrate-binding protein
VDGQTISLTWRCAEGRTEVARQLAEELVRLEVDVIVSSGLAGAHAVKAATHTVPIIFTAVGDPVEGGLVPSLTERSGNLTGVTNIPDPAFYATHLALLREAVPLLTRVALLLYADDPFRAGRIPPVDTAAKAVGLDLHLVEVATPSDFDAAFAAMTRQGVGGLLVSFTPFLTTYHPQLASPAAAHRLPAIAHRRAFAEHGGLMAYGWDSAELWREAVSYLERILQGAKPSDLPVQRPTTYQLVINLKTAQALGLTIAPTLLFKADEVIR